jgi:hypothetical protein
MRLFEFSNNKTIKEGVISRAVSAISSAVGYDEVASNRILKREIQRVVDKWNDYYRGLPTNLKQNMTMREIEKFFNDVGYGKSGPDIIRQQILPQTAQTQTPSFKKGDIVSYTTPSGVEETATVVDTSGDGENLNISMQREDGIAFNVGQRTVGQYKKVGSTVVEARAAPSDKDVLAVVQNMKRIIPLAITSAIDQNPQLWTRIAEYHSGKSSGEKSRQSGESQPTVSNRDKARIAPIARKLQRVDDRQIAELGLSNDEVEFLKQFLKNQAS